MEVDHVNNFINYNNELEPNKFYDDFEFNILNDELYFDHDDGLY